MGDSPVFSVEVKWVETTRPLPLYVFMASVEELSPFNRIEKNSQ
jgi:hypothetical protein